LDRDGNIIPDSNSQPKPTNDIIKNDTPIITDATSNAQPIALSHAVLCPKKRRLWIEGIRVKQNYRRSKVATALVDEMLRFGRSKRATEASAIISVNNIASRLLFEKRGFNIISKWGYYNIYTSSNKSYRADYNNKVKNKAKERMAVLKDINKIWNYLRSSETYRLSGKRYFEAWRWYSLDYKKTVELIKHHKIIITENNNSVIEGLAVINNTRYWGKTEVFQIVYLDSPSISKLRDLVSYCTDLHSGWLPNNRDDGRTKKNSNNKSNSKSNSNTKNAVSLHNSNQLQIISYQTNELSKIMSSFRIIESAQFLLYHRSL
jgi:hypothetical protein